MSNEFYDDDLQWTPEEMTEARRRRPYPDVTNLRRLMLPRAGERAQGELDAEAERVMNLLTSVKQAQEEAHALTGVPNLQWAKVTPTSTGIEIEHIALERLFKLKR